jgi:hypothetical protein
MPSSSRRPLGGRLGFSGPWVEVLAFSAIAASVFCIALRNLSSPTMLGFPDLVAFPPSWRVGYSYFLSSWNPSGFGGPSAPGNFVLWWTALETVLSPEAAQRFFFLALLPLSALTMFLASREFVQSPFIRVGLGVGYSVNSFAVGQFMAGEGTLVFYALVPVLFVLWRRSILEERIRRRVYFLLCFAVLAGVSWTFYVSGVLVLLLLLLIPLAGFLVSGVRIAVRAILSTLTGLVISLALNFRVLVSPIFSEGSTLASSQNFLAATQSVYRLEVPSPLALYQFIAGGALGLILAGISVSGLLFVNGPNRRTYVELAITGLAFSVVMWGVGTGLFLSVFSLSPIATFRDPHTALYSLTVAVVWSAGLSLEAAIGRIAAVLARPVSRPSSNRVVRRLSATPWVSTIAAAFLLAVLVASSAQPIESGTLGVVPQENYQVQSFEYSPYVPASFSQAAAYLSQQGYYSNTFNVLWLPLAYYTNSRTEWTMSLDSEALATLNATDAGQFTETLSSMFSNPAYPLGSLLSEAAVRYVVIDMTSPFEGPIEVEIPSSAEIGTTGYYPLYIFGSPTAFMNYFSNSSQFGLVYRTSQTAVFQNLAFDGLVQAYPEVALGVSSDSTGRTIPVGQNEVQNPDFASGLSPWQVGGTVTREQETTPPGSWANMSTDAVIDQVNLPVQQEHTYSVSLEAEGPLVGDWAIKILWFNRTVSVPSDSNAIGASYIYPSSGAAESEGIQAGAGNVTAPLQADYAAYVVYAGTVGIGGGYLLVTNLTFQEVYVQSDPSDLGSLALTTYANALLSESSSLEDVYFVPSVSVPVQEQSRLLLDGASILYQDQPGASGYADTELYTLQRATDTMLPINSTNLSATPFTSAEGFVSLPVGSSISDPLSIARAGSWELDLFGSNLSSLSLSGLPTSVSVSPWRAASNLTLLPLQDRAWILSSTQPIRAGFNLTATGQSEVSWVSLIPFPPAGVAPETSVSAIIDTLSTDGSIRFAANLDGPAYLVFDQASQPGWALSGGGNASEFSLGTGMLFRVSGNGVTNLTLSYEPSAVDSIALDAQFGIWTAAISALVVMMVTGVPRLGAVLRKLDIRSTDGKESHASTDDSRREP